MDAGDAALLPDPHNQDRVARDGRRVARQPFGFRPLEQRWCRELYAGHGKLSAALERRGFSIATPIEAIKDGRFRQAHNLESRSVHLKLLRDIKNQIYAYVHFGIVCTSWGPASRMSGGSRRPHCLYGNPPTERERRGNVQAMHMCSLLNALIDSGGFFTVENPAGSYLWDTKWVQRICKKTETYFVTFDQCQFGLRPPAARRHEYTRKRTTIWTNMKSFQDLAILCCGCSFSHVHVHAWGVRSVSGKCVRLACAAGSYPTALCEAIADKLSEHLSHGVAAAVAAPPPF